MNKKNFKRYKITADDMFYNPDVCYYMLSYIKTSEDGSSKWIRSPWNTEGRIASILNSLQSSKDRFDSLEIISEDILDIAVFIKNKDDELESTSVRNLIYSKDYLNDAAMKIRSEPGCKFDWKNYS